MIRLFSPIVVIVATLALSGCVVTPIEQRPQQPVYNAPPPAAPAYRALRIEGRWQLRERGQIVRTIDVRRVQGGIVIDGRRTQSFAQRVGPGVFRDDRGRTYQFFNDAEGQFENPNNGRRLNLRRPRG